MRLTRDNLQHWKDNLKAGDLVEFDVPYEATKRALVMAVYKDMSGIAVELGTKLTKNNKITRGVQWKKIMQIWTKEENPEMFL